METIYADNKFIKIILVKNPTGFDQVISYLTSMKTQNLNMIFAINDKLADGTDISWLWDVEFEKLLESLPSIDWIYTSGTRGLDMSLRLKYAGIPDSKLIYTPQYSDLIKQALNKINDQETLFILPTYTALLDIRKHLGKKYKLKKFWQ